MLYDVAIRSFNAECDVITLVVQTFTAIQSIDSQGERVVLNSTTVYNKQIGQLIDGTLVSVDTAGLVLGGANTVPFTPVVAHATEAVVTLQGTTFTAAEISGPVEDYVVI